MYFVGIDLAWSKNNGTGISVLTGDKDKAELSKSSIVYSNQDIIDFIDANIGNSNALITIDAPLVVPNNEGRRFAEAEVGRLFRKFNAGAYPSNRKIFNSLYGGIRGEEISVLLENKNFVQNPHIKLYEETRSFFEVYPHPSMVVLFNLNKILQYKPKMKRSYEVRYNEYEKYLQCLKELRDSNTKLILPDYILEEDFRKLKSRKLKDFEDKLDGIFCAYIAYYVWKNPDKCLVLGNINDGYIMTPVFDYMK